MTSCVCLTTAHIQVTNRLRTGYKQLTNRLQIGYKQVTNRSQTGYKWVGCACSVHVASVVQMTHMLMVHGGILKSKAMDRLQQLGTYWAATVHDFEHEGVNNDFLVKTAHPLAITYNDSSPLENHHLAASSRVFRQPECCFFPVSLPYRCCCHTVRVCKAGRVDAQVGFGAAGACTVQSVAHIQCWLLSQTGVTAEFICCAEPIASKYQKAMNSFL